MAASSSRGGQCLLEIPEDGMCPISKMLMEDPVVCADGHSYEREFIEQWLARGQNTSPMTNVRLPHTTLIPNINLRNIIQSLSDRMPEVQRQQLQQLRARLDVDAILEAVGEDQEKELRGLAPPGTSAQEPGWGSEDRWALSQAAGALAHGSPATQEEATAEDQQRQLSTRPAICLRGLGQAADLRGLGQTAGLRGLGQTAGLRGLGQTAGLRGLGQTAGLRSLGQTAGLRGLGQTD